MYCTTLTFFLQPGVLGAEAGSMFFMFASNFYNFLVSSGDMVSVIIDADKSITRGKTQDFTGTKYRFLTIFHFISFDFFLHFLVLKNTFRCENLTNPIILGHGIFIGNGVAQMVSIA